MITAVGSDDEGPSSKELWDKLCMVEHQNQVILDTMARVLAETQMTVPGLIGQRLRQIHSQLLSRMANMTEVPKSQ